MNAWVITKDLIAEPGAKPGTNRNAVGMTGPRSNKLTAEMIGHNPSRKPFRLLDDDGTLYYEGFLIGDETAPLDDFGEPNAGCTRIQLLENGIWTDIVS